MKQRRCAAEKYLQKSEENYRTSHCKFERFEVKCFTPTKKDVNIVYTVESFVFFVLQLGIHTRCRQVKLFK